MADRGRRDRRKPRADRPTREDHGDHDQRGPRLARIELACWTALLAAAVGALVWNQHAQFFTSWTDEQIHFYVARRMAEGAVLYRDVDSARPPLVLFPLAALVRMGASPLLAGRALVVGAQLATAGLLLWGGWRLVSVRAGVMAALVFLTSPEVYARVHYTGIHWAALTATACVLLSLRGQPLWAGVLFGLTLATDQHGLAVCGVVAVLTVLRRRRDGLTFAAGAVLVSAVVFGGVRAMGGQHLWSSLVGIHLFHLRVGQGVGAQFWEMFKPWLYEHAYLFAGAGVAAALLGATRTAAEGGVASPAPSRSVRVLLVVVGAHIAVVLALSEAVFLYVVVIFPILALLAGIGLDASLAWWRRRRQLSRVEGKRASRRILVGGAAALALTAGGWQAARSHREALDGRAYSFWPHALHAQVSRTQELDGAVEEIAGMMLPRQGTIFGDPTIVTALALRSGLRVSGELADLNPNWIEAGAVKPEDVVARIEADGVAGVISPPFGLLQNQYFKSYLLACYDKPRPFFPPESGPGEGLPLLLVFGHVDGTTRCQVPSQ
jgi:hypothetical protein